LQPGVTRVLAIGDSNTFGLYLREHESYPAQLEALWNVRHPDSKIKVINAGYPGTGSHRIASVIDQVQDITRPDIVLLGIGVADFFSTAEYNDPAPDLFSRLARALRRHKPTRVCRTAATEPAGGVTINQRDILHWSEDLAELRPVVEAFKRANNSNPGNPGNGDEFMTLGQQPVIMITAEENSEHPGKERGFHHLQHNLSCIRRKVRQHGAAFYLLSYPASSGAFARANREIRGYARNNPEVHLIDVAKGFREFCADSTQCPDLFFGDLHPTAKASLKVAELVAAGLERTAG
jgi:hypothetical protein